jgi:hypothetical protein
MNVPSNLHVGVEPFRGIRMPIDLGFPLFVGHPQRGQGDGTYAPAIRENPLGGYP